MKQTMDLLGEFYKLKTILERHGVYTQALESDLLKCSIEDMKSAVALRDQELIKIIEGMRKWADEATPEQKNNIDTYNECLTDVSEVVKNL
jgi:hypothetical protein